MLKNYIVVALRNLRRERLYAAINVIGLAVALTICLLAFAYIEHEWSFDRFHEKADSLYRVNYLIPTPNGEMQRFSSSAFVLAPILQEQLPEVAAVVRVTDNNDAIIQKDGAEFIEEFVWADSQFFAVFSFPLIAGNPASALNSPNSVVISQRLATKYFGNESVLGEILPMTIDGVPQDLEVTGVCENVPGNSTLEFDMVIPVQQLFALQPELHTVGWQLSWPAAYVELRPGVSEVDVDAKLKSLAATLPLNGGEGEMFSLGLQPITDIHFDPKAGANRTSTPLYSYVLAGVALLVLSLACINFMTLAVGRSQTRTKEVGIRKVLGAQRKQLIGRFLGEAAVLCFLATLVAFVAAELLLPTFNEISGKQIDRYIWFDFTAIGAAVLLIAVTSIFAGGYPATVLARTKIRDAVKGKAALLTGAGMTRALVALQFGFSIALIITAIIMSSQLQYLQSIPLGFDQEQLLMINLHGSGEEKIRATELIRSALAGDRRVKSVSAAYRSFDGSGMTYRITLPDSSMFTLYMNPADEYYVKTMGLGIVEGSDFTGSKFGDSLVPYLVNEEFVRKVGWTSAVGKQIPGSTDTRIIGVVNDFHFRSLTAPLEAMAIPYARSADWADRARLLYVRLAPGDPSPVVERIQDIWEQAAPNAPFEFQFMDEHIDAAYRAEQNWRRIISYSAILAIAVACFGAFGLTALAVARRQKEIGVRKVLGASSSQIVKLLNKEFVWLVMLGNLVAWPVAYFATRRWLEGFAYHISPTIWPFALAAVLTLMVVVATVSAQAMRAAMANPVKSLRYE